MCKLKVTDFYYGAVPNALLNTPDRHLVLFDGAGAKERRIYCLETNQSGELYIYAKYKAEKSAADKKRWHWSFTFTSDEVTKIQELYREKGKVKLALICIKKVEKRKKKKTEDNDIIEINLAESELAFIDYEDAMDCMGVNIGTKSNQIDIVAQAQKSLRMYGSGRSDKLNGKDNTLPVPRNVLETL